MKNPKAIVYEKVSVEDGLDSLTLLRNSKPVKYVVTNKKGKKYTYYRYLKTLGNPYYVGTVQFVQTHSLGLHKKSLNKE